MEKINRLTLIGMSGVGKTHLATILSNDNAWYHYSADYRIGSKYLSQMILDNIKSCMYNDKYLANLLNNNNIKIVNNISFDNISIVADFLGKIGNPELGGLQLEIFKQRQKMHLKAEKLAMLDTVEFIKKSKDLGIDNFINDTGGSICELDDNNIYQMLADNSLIVYIKANKKTQQSLIERAIKAPKPLYYNSNFFQQQLELHMQQQNLTYVAEIIPDDFVKFVFPKLLSYRLPKYQKIADNYGITINADELYLCKNSADCFDLIKQQCQ